MPLFSRKQRYPHYPGYTPVEHDADKAGRDWVQQWKRAELAKRKKKPQKKEQGQ